MTASERDGASALVRKELEDGLQELEAVDFQTEHELSDGQLRAVSWVYVAKLRPDHHFLGARLTEPLTLRGVTLIQHGPADNVQFRWYIDWLDALNRAGLNAALRPVPDGPQPQVSDLEHLLP
jgi:hypothetical protein